MEIEKNGHFLYSLHRGGGHTYENATSCPSYNIEGGVIIDHVKQGDNAFGSVSLFVCLSSSIYINTRDKQGPMTLIGRSFQREFKMVGHSKWLRIQRSNFFHYEL